MRMNLRSIGRVALVVALTAGLRAAPAHASCSPLPNLGLEQCPVNEPSPNWVNTYNANWAKLDFNFHTPLARSGIDITLGTVNEAHGGTNQTTWAVGDTPKVATADTITKLSGNATTTRQFRQQHGNGTAVTSDNWDGITELDLPPVRITALTQLDPALCAAGETFTETGGFGWGCTIGQIISILAQFSDSLCPAGESIRRKASGSGWECFTPSTAVTVPSLIAGSTGTSPVGGAAFDWWHLDGVTAATTTEADVSNVMPAGTFKKIGCRIATAQSTDSDGYTIGLAKVGTGITLQCNVFGAGTLDCTSTADYAVAAGDEFSWIAIAFGTQTPTVAKCWALFLPS